MKGRKRKRERERDRESERERAERDSARAQERGSEKTGRVKSPLPVVTSRGNAAIR